MSDHIASDLIAQSAEARRKAIGYTDCFANMEALIEALNGAKRHGFRMRFRTLQCELQAAVDELMELERQLLDVRRGLVQQAAFGTADEIASSSVGDPAKITRQDAVGSPETSAEVRQV